MRMGYASHPGGPCAGILMHDMQTTRDFGLIFDTNVEFDPQVLAWIRTSSAFTRTLL